jgi:hypothetical protein
VSVFGGALPDLPSQGIGADTAWTGPPGTVAIDRVGIAPS